MRIPRHFIGCLKLGHYQANIVKSVFGVQLSHVLSFSLVSLPTPSPSSPVASKLHLFIFLPSLKNVYSFGWSSSSIFSTYAVIDLRHRGHIALTVVLVITGITIVAVGAFILVKKGHRLPIPDNLNTFDNPLFFSNEQSTADVIDPTELVQNAEDESTEPVVTMWTIFFYFIITAGQCSLFLHVLQIGCWVKPQVVYLMLSKKCIKQTWSLLALSIWKFWWPLQTCLSLKQSLRANSFCKWYFLFSAFQVWVA